MPTTQVMGFTAEEPARKALFTFSAAKFKTLLIGPTPRVNVSADGPDLPWPNGADKQWWVVIATLDPIAGTDSSG